MTTTTVPSPAEMPRAGLPHLQAAARRFTEANVELSHAAPGALALLAAEQCVEPVTDPGELASPAPIPDDEADAFAAALHDEPPAVAPKPQPPFAWIPGTARQPNPMARDQYVRRAGLELAVRFYADDPEDRTDTDVLATAKVWAEWIRTGL